MSNIRKCSRRTIGKFNAAVIGGDCGKLERRRWLEGVFPVFRRWYADKACSCTPLNAISVSWRWAAFVMWQVWTSVIFGFECWPFSGWMGFNVPGGYGDRLSWVGGGGVFTNSGKEFQETSGFLMFLNVFVLKGQSRRFLLGIFGTFRNEKR